MVVTIVGAESSGKTILAKQLASLIGCNWVPEYAREYLGSLDRPYEFDDLEKIAKGQWDSIVHAVSKAKSEVGPKSTPTVISSNQKIEEIKYLITLLKPAEQNILIVDSGMLTIRMWARIKYGRNVFFLESVMNDDPTDLYLLCRPKKEWENDPLREAPVLVDRVWIFNQYLKEIIDQEFQYKIVQLRTY